MKLLLVSCKVHCPLLQLLALVPIRLCEVSPAPQVTAHMCRYLHCMHMRSMKLLSNQGFNSPPLQSLAMSMSFYSMVSPIPPGYSRLMMCVTMTFVLCHKVRSRHWSNDDTGPAQARLRATRTMRRAGRGVVAIGPPPWSPTHPAPGPPSPAAPAILSSQHGPPRGSTPETNPATNTK
jgi:hypothetical protein